MIAQQTWPDFATLWGNYPHNLSGPNGEKIIQHPSNDPWANQQCAVRLSKTLMDSGVDMSSYPTTESKMSEGWASGSKSLAWWLWGQLGKPVGGVNGLSQAEFNNNYGDKTGIIYEFPFPGQSTGHIDLYNKGEGGSGYYSAPTIWFWEIK